MKLVYMILNYSKTRYIVQRQQYEQAEYKNGEAT